MRAWLLMLLLVTTRPALGDESITHLLKGAQLFRAEKYSEALVEFRVAEKLGAGGEASWYAAAALVKLNKPLDALETFALAERGTSVTPDALLIYYRALACYDAKLFVCADQLLAKAGDRAGPKVSAQIAKTRGEIAALLKREPSTSSIDWYHEEGSRLLEQKRAALAVAFFKEALALSDRRGTPYRRDAALTAIDQAQKLIASAEEKP